MIPTSAIRLAALCSWAALLAGCHGDSAVVGTSVHEPPAPLLGQVCGLDGFCWNNPLPGTTTIGALWGSQWNDVWAGSRDGLLHFDGGVWKVSPLPGGAARIRSIWGSGAADVWAAGDSVFHWDGRSWTATAGLPAGDQSYVSITGSGKSDVWVLVDTGNGKDERHSILHWNGSAWSTQYGPVAPTLEALFAAGPGSAFAVGVKVPGLTSEVVHLTGGAWLLASVPAGDPLRAVWGSGPSDVWAVGGSTALHFDGNTWTQVAVAKSAAGELASVYGTGPTDVWAGANGTILHWDGHTFTQTYGGSGADDRPIAAIYSSGARDSWAAAGAGQMLHHDGTGWSTFTQGSTEYLDAAFASSANDVWAVGGHGVALHFDGASWQQISTPSVEPLYAVWSRAANDAWIAGASGDCLGFVLHWNGTAWSSSFGPTASTCMSGIWGTGAADVWALAYRQLLHWDGASWSTTGPNDVARAVWASAQNDVWVLQDSIQGGANAPGGVYHYDGAHWTLQATGSTAQLHTLWGTGANDVWITSDDAANVLHWNGAKWSAVPTGIASDGAIVNSVWGTGPSDLWLGGSGIPVLRFNGQSFASPPGAETRSISALAGAGGKVFGVGADGAILGKSY